MRLETDRTGLHIGIDGRELLADRVTGIGRYLHNFLSSGVFAYPEHTFIVYGNHLTVLKVQAPNLILRIVPERFTFWWDQITLARIVQQDHLDVFFSPYDKGPLFVSCPVVLTVHDLLFLAISDHNALERLCYNAAYLSIRGLIIRRAMRIITDSDHSRKDIIRRLRVKPERICVIPIGIAASYSRVEDPSQLGAFKARYGIARPYILYVGNFKPHKNVGALVDAYAALPDNLKARYQMVLCGRRDRFRDRIQTQAEGQGIQDRLRFLDFVPDEDMPLLYSAADAFVFPSLYEGFGLPPLEAMACGTPVISSRATSLPEVVGDAGILVDARHPGNIRRALQEVLTQEGLRRSLVASGIRRARQFTVDTPAERILDTLEEAASLRKRARNVQGPG